MTTELTILTTGQIPALTDNRTAMIIRNLAGEEITPNDLTRIRVPTGGATVWSVPGPDGTEETLKAIDVVIVHIGRRRSYWKQSKIMGDIPDCCASGDCLVGVGDPGGDCATCPYNQFGSARGPDGTPRRGKACKENKLLFSLREVGLLPWVVVVPPASLKAMREYQFRLALPFWSVVTRLELLKRQNRDGNDYAQVKATQVEVLDATLAEKILCYGQEIQAVFSATTIQREDIYTEEDGGSVRVEEGTVIIGGDGGTVMIGDDDRTVIV